MGGQAKLKVVGLLLGLAFQPKILEAFFQAQPSVKWLFSAVAGCKTHLVTS